jgi:hypothetical protein
VEMMVDHDTDLAGRERAFSELRADTGRERL